MGGSRLIIGVLVGVVLGVVLWASVPAIAALVTPPKDGGSTFFADDATLGFGNTSGSPDTKIGWETTGTDHLSLVTTADTCVVVSSDADVNRTGLTCTDTRLCVASDDSTNVDEAVCLYHDEADGWINIPDGDMRFFVAGGQGHFGQGDVFQAHHWNIASTSNSVVSLRSGTTDSTAQFQIHGDWADDETRMVVGASSGNAMVLTLAANRNKDHDLVQQNDPVFYIWGQTDPDSVIPAGTRHLSLTYEDDLGEQYGEIATGAGDLAIEPASGYVRQMRRWLGPCTVSHDGGTNQCFTVADGDVVTNILFRVTEVWDGSSGSLKLGDGNNDDGFGEMGMKTLSGTRDLGNLGWMWTSANDKGAYLYAAGSGGAQSYGYTGADTVDALSATGDATQGEGKFYVEISRLP